MVHLFMDVEDPINRRADDAALDFARLFSEEGVRGNFCVTGEKCRTLVARGRTDVLEALAPHCLGLHTDTHSVHPTTMEMLADVPLAEGVVLAECAERRGYEAFVAAFGRPPAFWGGAGNTWSPEITVALRRLGVPAYVYALTEVPDRAVHGFNGVAAYPQHLSVSEDEWADDAVAADRTRALLRSLSESPARRCVFVGHPTRFRHGCFWDAPFANGRCPEVPEPSEPVSEDAYTRAKRNLAAFLRRVGQAETVVGLDEGEGPRVPDKVPDEATLTYFRRKTARNLREAARWPIHRTDLDVEGIVAKTMALAETLRV